MRIYSIDLLYNDYERCITQHVSQGYYLNRETAEAAMAKLKDKFKDTDARRSLRITAHEVNED